MTGTGSDTGATGCAVGARDGITISVNLAPSYSVTVTLTAVPRLVVIASSTAENASLRQAGAYGGGAYVSPSTSTIIAPSDCTVICTSGRRTGASTSGRCAGFALCRLIRIPPASGVRRIWAGFGYCISCKRSVTFRPKPCTGELRTALFVRELRVRRQSLRLRCRGYVRAGTGLIPEVVCRYQPLDERMGQEIKHHS